MINIINIENKLPIIIENNNSFENLEKVVNWFKKGSYDFCNFFIIDNNSDKELIYKYEEIFKDFLFSVIKLNKFYLDVYNQIHIESKVPFYMYLTPNVYPADSDFNDLFKRSILFLKENRNVKYIQLQDKDKNEVNFKIVNNNANYADKRYILNEPFISTVLENKYIKKEKSENFIKRFINKRNIKIKELPQKFINRDIDKNMDILLFEKYIKGKRFLCKTKDGKSFNLFFKSLNRCVDNSNNIATIKIVSGKISLLWKSGPFKKSVISCLSGYTRIHGINDMADQFIGILEHIARSESKDIMVEQVRKNLNNLTIIACAYKVENQRIDSFLKNNHYAFSKTNNLQVIIVTDINNNYVSKYDYCKIIKYPFEQKMFSIGKTINYGIRQTENSPHHIIIKTDIDILFSNSILNHIIRTVDDDYGLVCLSSSIPSWNNIELNNMSFWKRKPKDPEGKGACFALTRNDWFKLKGYDERLEGWGGDDTEMWQRSKKRLRNIKTDAMFPLYHVKHPRRINTTDFIFNSERNMKVCAKLDWNNNNWGTPYSDCTEYSKKCNNIQVYRILSDYKNYTIQNEYKSFLYSIPNNDYSVFERNAISFTSFTKKVSIIICTYNRYDLLLCHLQALCNQTYNHKLMEIIIADDGSSDQTKNIINTQYPFPIKYVYQKDKGYRLSKIRNEAIKIASHEIVIISDVDMIPVADYVSNHMRWHHVCDNCAVIGHRRYVDPKDIILRRIRNNPNYLYNVPDTIHKRLNISTDWRIERYKQSSMLKNHREPWLHLCGGNVSLKKSTFIQVGMFDDDFQSWGGEDQEFSYRLYKNGIYMIPDLKATGLHVEHDVDISKHNENQQKARRLINQKKINFDNTPTYPAPKITIFIPVFNRGHYLKMCLESAVKQKYQDYEILICDDASTDNSPIIIKSFMSKYNKPGKRPLIRYIRRQQNGGIAKVWNMCFRHAKGKYLLQLDGDDWIDINTLAQLIRFCNKENCLVHGGYTTVSSNGQTKIKNYISHFSEKELFNLGNCVSPPRMFNKEFYFMTEGCNESYKNAVDYDLVSKVCRYGKVQKVNNFLYFYRQHPKQTTKEFNHVLKNNHKNVIKEVQRKIKNEIYNTYYEILE